MELPALPLSLPQAIAREEGYYVDGSRANRNNNPGNIEYGLFAQEYGATSGDPRFAIFPSPEAGFSALVGLLLKHYRGLTIAEAITKWAPPNENNTVAYINSVSSWIGQPSTTVIDGVLENANSNSNDTTYRSEI